MNVITIQKKDGILKGELTLPASKSISNRALIIRFLSGNKPHLQNLSSSGDTQLMIRLLQVIEENRESSLPVILDCNNAGTVMRFLTSCLSITPGKWLLTGSDRMNERPVGILVDSLKQLGATIAYKGQTGFPPLLIEGKKLSGGDIEIDGSVSSQFISSLLLVAPSLSGGLSLKLKGKIGSLPYIEMTLKLLNQFGISTTFLDNTIRVGQLDYKPGELTIEPDWTSASYWYEMVAFATKANLFLKGLKKESLQGDAILPEIFNYFGVKTEFLADGIKLTKSGKNISEFKFDFTHCPDLAQAVIVTCAGLNIPGKFSGLESLRIKETDRITALSNELEKLDYKIRVMRSSEIINLYSKPDTRNQKPVTSDEQPGTKIQKPGTRNLKPETWNLEPETWNLEPETWNLEPETRNTEPVKTYDDHRMALAFAPLALIFGSVQIQNPEVVTKSYPGFWEDLLKTGFRLI